MPKRKRKKQNVSMPTTSTTSASSLKRPAQQPRPAWHLQAIPSVNVFNTAQQGWQSDIATMQQHYSQQGVAEPQQPEIMTLYAQQSIAVSNVHDQSENVQPFTAEQKIEIKKEKNRLAQQRCRDKRIQRVNHLEEEIVELSENVNTLRSEVDLLDIEKKQLQLKLSQLENEFPSAILILPLQGTSQTEVTSLVNSLFSNNQSQHSYTDETAEPCAGPSHQNFSR